MAFSREQKRNAENRSGRESSRLEQESKKDLIMKREFHPAILLFLTLYLAVGSEVLPLVLSYIIALLLLGLENLLGYLHTFLQKLHSPLAASYLPYAEYHTSKHPYTYLDPTIHLHVHHPHMSEDLV